MPRVVLAYSGGPGSEHALARLLAGGRAEVITLTLDLGQRRDLADIRDRAMAQGAVRAHVLDAREEFARDFALPLAQALSIGGHPAALAIPLSRPLIARHLVRVAGMETAPAIAHGSPASSPDHLRFERLVGALQSSIRVLSPVAAADASRPAEAPQTPGRRDAMNLWGRSMAGAGVDDPWIEPPEEVYAMTRAPGACPSAPATVELRFERGVPVAVNAVAMPLVDLLDSLGTIAGAHGVGRSESLDDGWPETPSRRIHEAPAAEVLCAAHAALQALVGGRDVEVMVRQAAIPYARLVYDGRWFTPLREALDAFVQRVQQEVTGTVRVRLFEGRITIVGRRAGVPPRTEPAGAVAGVPERSAVRPGAATPRAHGPSPGARLPARRPRGTS